MSSESEDKLLADSQSVPMEINNNNNGDNKVKKSVMNSTAKEFIPKNKQKDFDKALEAKNDPIDAVANKELSYSGDCNIVESDFNAINIYSTKSIDANNNSRPTTLVMNANPTISNTNPTEINSYSQMYPAMPVANQPIFPMDYVCITNPSATMDQQTYFSNLTTTSPVIVQQASIAQPTATHNQLNFYQNFHNSGGSSPHSYQSVSPPILPNNSAPSTGNVQTAVTNSSGAGNGEHYVMVHVNLGETFSIRVGDQIQNISGPATVRMVSNNGPPTPMPMQVPPGHMVQQIVDENGILTHVILSPLHHQAQGPPNTSASPCIGPHLHSNNISSNPTQKTSNVNSNSSVSYFSNSSAGVPSSNYSNNFIYHNGSTPTTNNNNNGIVNPHHHYHNMNSTSNVHSNSEHQQPHHPHNSAQQYHYTRSNQNPTDSAKSRSKTRNQTDDSVKLRDTNNLTSTSLPPTTASSVAAATSSTLTSISSTTINSSSNNPVDLKENPPQHHYPSHHHYQQQFHHYQQQSHHRTNNNSQTGSNNNDFYSNSHYHSNFPKCNNNNTSASSITTASTNPTGNPYNNKNRKRRFTAGKYNYSASANTKHALDHTGSPLSSADEVSTILTDEEKNAIRDVLNTIEKPEVSEIEARSSLIHIKCPKVPDNCVATINSADFAFQLHFAERNPDSRFNCVFYGEAVEISLQDLKPATDYFVKVCCIYENIIGNLSDINKFTTKPSEPNCPKPVVIQSKSRNSIQVKWFSPVENGSKISEFILEYSRADSNTDTYNVAYRGNNKTFKIQKLKPSTEYLIRLAAVNSYGQSGWSDTISVTTSGTAPPTPEPPCLARADTCGLLLTWKKRPSDETFCLEMMDEATGYGFITIFNGSEVEHYVENLRRNTDYRFRLAASNLDGRSKWSETVKLSTKPALPGAPTRLHTRGKIHPTQCTLVWDPPEDDGGLQIDCYRLELDTSSAEASCSNSSSTDQDRDWVVVYEGASREFACSKLSPGSTIYARVSALSTALNGWGPTNTPLAVTMAATVPGQMLPPRKDLYQASAAIISTSTGGTCGPAGSRSKNNSTSGASFVPGGINLIWEPPENDGGSPIIHYELCQWYLKSKLRVSQSHADEGSVAKIEDTLEETDEQIVYKGDQLNCLITGLIPGSHYRYCIRAVNKAGFSRWSSTMDATSGPSVPDAPSGNPQCTAKSPQSIAVAWTMPLQSNGSPITEYKVEYRAKADSGAEYHTGYIGGSLSCDVKNLQPNTTYLVRVLAANRAGYSQPSCATEVTTACSVPSQCSGGLKLGAVTLHSVQLSWKEPACCGGAPLTGYFIEISCSAESVPASLAVPDGSSLVFCENNEKNITDLLPDTTYKFRVQAQNSVGVGPFSTMVKATTLSPPPAPPVLECVTVMSNSIKLRWHNQLSPRQYYISKMKLGDATNGSIIATTGAPAATVVSSIPSSLDMNIAQYQLQMSRQPDSGWSTIYTGPAQFHKHSKLLESTNYYFRVMASSDAGDGDFSQPPVLVTTDKAAPPAVRAPKISDVTSNSCLVEWPALRSMNNDPIVYILQLLTISEKDSDYRSVYRGSDVSHRLLQLSPSTEYVTRVCAVRLCSSSSIVELAPHTNPSSITTSTTSCPLAGGDKSTSASPLLSVPSSNSSPSKSNAGKSPSKHIPPPTKATKCTSSPVTELIGPFSKSISFATLQYGAAQSAPIAGSSNTREGRTLVPGGRPSSISRFKVVLRPLAYARNLAYQNLVRPWLDRVGPWTDKHAVIVMLALFTLVVVFLAQLIQSYLK